MDRAPGLSVRLKLTLSYAGFLMLAGTLLFAIVLVIILQYLPDVGNSPAGPLVRSDLLRSVATSAARGANARHRSWRSGTPGPSTLIAPSGT